MRTSHIRHFGLLANRTRQAKLARCRQLLAVRPPAALKPRESVAALMLRLTGIDIERCPVCQEGRLRIVAILVPTTRHAAPVLPRGTRALLVCAEAIASDFRAPHATSASPRPPPTLPPSIRSPRVRPAQMPSAILQLPSAPRSDSLESP